MTNRDLLFFAVGLTVGAVASYFVTKTKIEKECYRQFEDEHLEEVRKQIEHQSENGTVDGEIVEEHQLYIDEDVPDEDFYADKVSSDSVDVQMASFAAEKSEKHKRLKSQYNKIVEDNGYGLGLTEHPRDEDPPPYIISSEEVGNCGFAFSCVKWWANYNMATWEDTEVEVEDAIERFGIANIRDIETDNYPDVGYIRNEKYETDYEIEVTHDECPFFVGRVVADED